MELKAVQLAETTQERGAHHYPRCSSKGLSKFWEQVFAKPAAEALMEVLKADYDEEADVLYIRFREPVDIY